MTLALQITALATVVSKMTEFDMMAFFASKLLTAADWV